MFGTARATGVFKEVPNRLEAVQGRAVWQKEACKAMGQESHF